MQKHEGSFKKILQTLSKTGYKTQFQLSYANSQNSIRCQIIQLFAAQFPFPLETLIEQFYSPVELPLNQMGKKSNEVLFSQSMKYVLKKITKTDLQKMEKFASSYKLYIDNNSSTMLCKILKVFQIRYGGESEKNDFYMIMEGLRPSKKNLSYDIKGYIDGRRIKGYSLSFGKDQEFVESKELKCFVQNSTTEERRQILERIKKDTSFLQQHQIMDYSLLMTFGQQITEHYHYKIKDTFITVGIIDYLQEFNAFKKLESRLKGWFKADHSSIESKEYRQRIISFLNKHWQIDKEEDHTDESSGEKMQKQEQYILLNEINDP